MKVNKRTILTAASCAGTVVTAVLAARGGAKCDRILNNMPPEATAFDKFKKAAPVYIPAAAAAVATIGSTIAAHHTGTVLIASGAASLAAMTQKAKHIRANAEKYRNTAVKLFGEEKEKEIRTELAKPVVPKLDEDGEVLHRFKMDWLGKTVEPIYFESSLATALDAMMTLNQFIFDPMTEHNYQATVSDFLMLVNHRELCTDRTDKAGWDANILAADCGAYSLMSSFVPLDDDHHEYEIVPEWYPSLNIESYVEMCEREGII